MPRQELGKIQDDQSYAINYLCEFTDSGKAHRARASSKQYEPFEIAIASLDDDLARLTKKGSLVASALALTHANAYASSFRSIDAGSVGIEGVQVVREEYAHCGDLAALGRYLKDCSPLIKSGQLEYRPVISQREYLYDTEKFRDSDGWAMAHNLRQLDPFYGRFGLDQNGRSNESKIIYQTAVDMVVAGRSVIDVLPKATLKSKLVRKLLWLEIPYLEGTTLRDYCLIATSESEALVSLQRYLRQKLLSIGEDPDIYESELLKLRLNIEEDLDAIKAEMSRLMRRSAPVQATGAVLATVTAVLVAVRGSHLPDLVQAIDAGGLWAAFTTGVKFADNRAKITKRPCYFLWLLSKQSKKLN